MCAWRGCSVRGDGAGGGGCDGSREGSCESTCAGGGGGGGGGGAFEGGGGGSSALTGCMCTPCVRPICEEECFKTTYNPVRGDCPTCAGGRGTGPPASVPPPSLSGHGAHLFCEECFAILGKNLLKAAQQGSTHEVRMLLDSGADVNFTFKSEWTPLHRAAAKGHADVVALLLRNGANYNARTCCGFAALHMAAWQDTTGRCVAMLLNAGCHVDIWNAYRRTPLHYAAENGNEAAVRALVAAGASKITKDDRGMTPFDVAKNGFIRRLIRRI